MSESTFNLNRNHFEYSILFQILFSICILLLILSFGCASGKRNPLPKVQFLDAEVLNTKGIRTFGGELNPLFQEDLLLSVKQIPKEELSKIQNSALLLSGGGSYGAFGAGFLNGWSASGATLSG